MASRRQDGCHVRFVHCFKMCCLVAWDSFLLFGYEGIRIAYERTLTLHTLGWLQLASVQGLILEAANKGCPEQSVQAHPSNSEMNFEDAEELVGVICDQESPDYRLAVWLSQREPGGASLPSTRARHTSSPCPLPPLANNSLIASTAVTRVGSSRWTPRRTFCVHLL